MIGAVPSGPWALAPVAPRLAIQKLLPSLRSVTWDLGVFTVPVVVMTGSVAIGQLRICQWLSKPFLGVIWVLIIEIIDLLLVKLADPDHWFPMIYIKVSDQLI